MSGRTKMTLEKLAEVYVEINRTAEKQTCGKLIQG